MPVPASASRPRAAASAVLVLVVVLGLVGLFVVVGVALVVFVAVRAAPDPTPSHARPTLTSLPTTLAASAEPEVAPTATFELHNRISGYQSSYYVLGMVKNTSPFAIEKPQVVVVLHDAAGKELATRTGYAELDTVAPGESSPIKVLVDDPPRHDKLSFEVTPKKASYIPEQVSGLGLTILEKPSKTFGNSWQVSGKVVNDGSAPAKFVKIQVLSYDNVGHLVGVDFTYADKDVLEPHADSRFRAMFTLDRDPAKFVYTVSGRPAR